MVTALLLVITAVGLPSFAMAGSSTDTSSVSDPQTSGSMETASASASSGSLALSAASSVASSATSSTSAGSSYPAVPGYDIIGDSVTSPFKADELLDIDVEQLITDVGSQSADGPQQTQDGTLLPQSVSAGNFSTLIRFAMQYRNWPYLWGSASPEPDENGNIGFDCSGLVIYCYNNALGAGVSRTSASDLFNSHCTQISADEARPGDLVFYQGTYSLGNHDYYLNHISHVAIYCGSGIVYCAGDPIGFYPVNGAENIDGDPAVYFYARLDTIDNSSSNPAADIETAWFPAYDYSAYKAFNPGNSNVAYASQVDAFDYFMSTGVDAGQQASYVFDVNYYRANNPDLVAKYGNNTIAYYQDFLDTGMALGRKSSDWFDVNYYRANNPDLEAKYGDDLAAYYRDFESTGRAEGRWGFDMSDISCWNCVMTHEVRDATGSALSPDITVSLHGLTLAAGTDYVVSYTDASGAVSSDAPSEVGSYTVAVSGTGSYKGTKTLGTFSIYDVSGAITSGAHYRLRSLADLNYVLDAAANPPARGANISVWADNGGTNQEYILEADGNGYYILQNCGNSSLVLDVSGGSSFAGCNVTAWTYNGGDNQRWALVPTGGDTAGAASAGSFTLVAAYNSNLVLDVEGGVARNDANVDVWTYNGGNNQKWSLVMDGQGYTDISSATVTESGMVRNATGVAVSPTVSASIGGTVLLRDVSFTLTYTGIGQTNYPTTTMAPTAGGTYEVGIKGMGIYSGTKDVGTFTVYDVSASAAADTSYRIINGGNDALLLDAAGGALSGANVQVWSDNGGYNQTFTFDTSSDGYYVIRSYADPSLVLDVAGASTQAGTNVSVWTYNGGLNQKWIIIPVGDGSFKMVAAYDTDLELNASGNPPTRGANVSVWTDNGGANQHWTFSTKQDLGFATVASSGMIRDYSEKAAASGTGFSPTVTLTLQGKTLTEGKDYLMYYNGAATAPSAAGDYTVVVRGTGNYFGTKTIGTLRIIDARSYVGEGTAYNIRSDANMACVLDAAGYPPALGANISVWTSNGGYNQGFAFELGTDGYYVIRSCADSSLVLDAAGASTQPGTNVSAWTYNGGLNQKWVVIPRSDGSVKMVAAYDTDLVLDAAGAASSGANVSVWTDNGGTNQGWILFPAVFQSLSITAASTDRQ